MKIKKISLILICCLVLLLLNNVTAVKPSDGTNIEITMVNQEPDPVEPGGYVDVRFRIENYGSDSAVDMYVKLIEKYPFSLEQGTSAEKFIGSLESMQTGEDGIMIKYRLKVDENAVEGAMPIELWYKFGKLGEWIKPEEFNITVRTYDVVLAVESVYSIPEIIPPGDTAKVKITLKNLADSYIKDIKIRLDLSSDSLPFVPVHSSTEKKIYQIGSNTEKNIYFDIMAMASAEAGAYKIPFNMSYSDDIGTYYSKSDIISLVVGDAPDLSVIVDSSEIYKKNSYGKVVLKFVNKGLSNIKFLNVKLEESKEFDIISSEEVYIGDIDSDDYETTEFSIYVKNINAGGVILPIKLEYMDANNKRFSETRNVRLKLFNTREAKKYGLEENRIIGIGIVIAIVAVGMYFLLRKRKKKKRR